MMSETGESAERSIIEHESKLPGLLAGILLVAAVLAVLAVGFYVLRFYDAPISSDPAAWGQLGDYFGGVLNPAFSFFALLGLLMTLAVQAKELRLSREIAKASKTALEMSQMEMAKSAIALDRQNDALERQRIEQFFFSWLGSCRNLLSAPASESDLGSMGSLLAMQSITYNPTNGGGACEVFFSGYIPSEGVPARDLGVCLKEEIRSLFSIYPQARTCCSAIADLIEWAVYDAGQSEDVCRRYLRIIISQLSSNFELPVLAAYYQLDLECFRGDLVPRYQLFDSVSFSDFPALRFLDQHGRPL